MMRVYKKCLFVFFCAVAIIMGISHVFAMASLDQSFDSLKNYQADFTQITTSNGQVIAKTSGKLWIRRPFHMRWQVMKPDAQTLLVNHHTIIQINPDLNQATIRQMNATEQSNAGLLLASGTELSKQFIIKKLTDKNGTMALSLTPKNSIEITKIILNFNANGLSSLKTWNTLGQLNSFKFSKVDTHSSISDSIFIFKPSKDMAILKSTV
jgi:outer membrane lipoprotein carrier protein